MIIFLLLLSLAHASSPKEEWLKWKAEETRYHKSEPCGPFTVQDGITLDKGETAYLVGHYSFVKALGPHHLFVEFDGEKLLATYPNQPKVNLLEQKEWKAPNGLYLRGRKPTPTTARVTVFDPQDVRAKKLKLTYFPFNPQAHVRAKIERDPANTLTKFKTSRGNTQEYHRLGVGKFVWKGKEKEITLYTSAEKSTDIFIPYKDQTNGKSTYGAGRFVNAKLDSLESDFLVIDFNQSYNPYCAYSHLYDCPLVLGNNLDFEMTAGELKPAAKK